MLASQAARRKWRKLFELVVQTIVAYWNKPAAGHSTLDGCWRQVHWSVGQWSLSAPCWRHSGHWLGEALWSLDPDPQRVAFMGALRIGTAAGCSGEVKGLTAGRGLCSGRIVSDVVERIRVRRRDAFGHVVFAVSLRAAEHQDERGGVPIQELGGDPEAPRRSRGLLEQQRSESRRPWSVLAACCVMTREPRT